MHARVQPETDPRRQSPPPRLRSHPMPWRLASVLAAAAVVAAGCGDRQPALPSSCVEGAEPIVAALKTAPGRVALSDGTRLSTCVERAREDADLQNLATLYTRVADELRRRAGARKDAALQLGYLIGAARRGARHTNGIHLELIRRLAQTVGLDGMPPATRASYRRGVAAGTSSG